MANLLKGNPVAKAIMANGLQLSNSLIEKGITPTLAILRVGEKDNDLSYERAVLKRSGEANVVVKSYVLADDVSEEEFFETLSNINNDPTIHGILMFRPLPAHIDEKKACEMISIEKDIDGYSEASLTNIITNTKKGFGPCTAEAVIEILDYYNIDVTGKRVCIIGRSQVIGKPVAMMLLNKNATVTICHSRSVNIASITKDCDIIVAASGQMESLNSDYFTTGQTVIDVGVSYNELKQKICGDVDFDLVEPIVENITPVPGGVGSVTTSILIKHVVEAARRTI